jgi:hypothetical protein
MFRGRRSAKIYPGNSSPNKKILIPFQINSKTREILQNFTRRSRNTKHYPDKRFIADTRSNLKRAIDNPSHRYANMQIHTDKRLTEYKKRKPLSKGGKTKSKRGKPQSKRGKKCAWTFW